MKNHIVFLFALAVFAGVVFGCGIFSEKYEKSETEELSISASGRKSLNLENVNGRIELNQSSDSGIVKIIARKEITVPKKDLDKPFDEIKLKIDSSGSEIRIDSEIRAKNRVRFFNFGSLKSPRIDYEIFVPPGLQIVVSNVNGDVTSGRLASDVKIELVNGDVNIDNYTGLFESEVTNGEVSVEVDSTTGIDIETVNGSVDLTFGETVSGNLKVETTNGKIFDENMSLSNVKREKKYLKAEFGNAPGPSISVSTVNGRITLKGKGKNWQ